MAKIHKLLQNCFIATDISEGDVFQAGGNLNSDASFIKTDFLALKDLFNDLEQDYNHFSFEKAHQYVASLPIKTDPAIYTPLMMFQKVMEKSLLPKSTQDLRERQKLYRMNEETLLSEVVNKNHMACTEFVILAAKFLQDKDLSVTLFAGAIAHDLVYEDIESEPHFFLVIEKSDSEQVIFYDPTNPVLSDQGHFPCVFLTSKKDYQNLLDTGRTQMAFLELASELSNRNKCLGVAPAGVTFFQKHILRPEKSLQNLDLT